VCISFCNHVLINWFWTDKERTAIAFPNQVDLTFHWYLINSWKFCLDFSHSLCEEYYKLAIYHFLLSVVCAALFALGIEFSTGSDGDDVIDYYIPAIVLSGIVSILKYNLNINIQSLSFNFMVKNCVLGTKLKIKFTCLI
jgi:hypothetical protein